MWLEAILTREDLQEVVQEFSPLEIRLGDSGSLLLVAPSDVSVIPGQGVGVKCDATLHWPVLGLDVPVSMRALTLRVLPRVENRPQGATLVFRLQIDHTGVAMLPSFFDDRVTARVNEELEQKHVELAWNFVDALSHVFRLPPALASASAFVLTATAGKVEATETALGLAVNFRAEVRARGPSGDQDPSKGGDKDSPAGHAPSTLAHSDPPGGLDARSLAIGAVATGLLFTGVRAIAGLGKPRRR
jgi:hypothetical protein